MHTQHHAAGTSPIAYMLGLPAFHTSPEMMRGVRAQAEQQVDSLIAFLDAMDGDPDLEPYLAGTDGDDREGDAEEDEPSLGFLERNPGCGAGVEYSATLGWDMHDLELDDCDDEETDHSGCGDEDALHLEQFGENELGATEDLNHDLAWELKSGVPWSVTDGEPLLGWTGHGTGLSLDEGSPRDDREEDAGDEGEMDDDREPSLGSLDKAINQGAWSMGNLGLVDFEEEHDGREREEGIKPFLTDRPVRLSDVAGAVFISLKASKTGVIAAWPR